MPQGNGYSSWPKCRANVNGPSAWFNLMAQVHGPCASCTRFHSETWCACLVAYTSATQSGDSVPSLWLRTLFWLLETGMGYWMLQGGCTRALDKYRLGGDERSAWSPGLLTHALQAWLGAKFMALPPPRKHPYHKPERMQRRQCEGS